MDEGKGPAQAQGGGRPSTLVPWTLQRSRKVRGPARGPRHATRAGWGAHRCGESGPGVRHGRVESLWC